MKETHPIMLISTGFVEDPVLMESMKMLFVWANQMGLKNLEVNDLNLRKQEENFLFECTVYREREP